MNDDVRVDQLFADALAELAPARAPRRLKDDINNEASRLRPRSRWLACIKEPPMHTSSRLAVGSPVARVAAIVTATLLLALTIAAAGLAGTRLMAANAPIVVARDGSGTVRTIGEALQVAEDGDRILVRPGTYEAGITIDKDIELVGDGPREEVVLDWSSSTLRETFDEGTEWQRTAAVGVTIRDSDAALSGLTLLGPAEGVAVAVDGGSPTLADLAIDMASSDESDLRVAIYLSGAATPTITDSSWDAYLASRDGAAPTLEGNTISLDTVSIDGPGEVTIRENSFDGGASISLSAGARGIVEDNSFEGGGIGIDTGSEVEVRGNALLRGSGELGEAAIYVRDRGSAAEITENEVMDSGLGVQVGPGASATISRNRMSGNDVGISLLGDSQILRENEVYGGRVGIVSSAGMLELVDNVVEGTSGRGLAIGLVKDATVTGNRSCGNGENLWVADNATIVVDDSNEICDDAPPE